MRVFCKNIAFLIGIRRKNKKKQSLDWATVFLLIVPHRRVMPFYKPAVWAGWVLTAVRYLSSTDMMRPDISAMFGRVIPYKICGSK